MSSEVVTTAHLQCKSKEARDKACNESDYCFKPD